MRTEIALLAQAENPSTLKDFDEILYRHIGSGMANLARTLWAGLTGGRCKNGFSQQKHLRYYYRQYARMSSALACVSDITLLILGGDLKRQEFLSARLGDVLSYLYLASAVLKYDADQNHPADSRCYVEWSLQYGLAKIQQAFDEFFDNFPQRGVGKCLRLIVFPWGRAYRFPLDALSRQVAVSLLQPSLLRDGLSSGCYVNTQPSDISGRLEYALRLQTQILPLEKKLKKAQKFRDISL